jgi:hypothetical protein
VVFATLEGSPYGFGKGGASKREHLRDCSEVVEVFHASVCHPELDQRFKFFGHNGFSWIRKKEWGGKLKKCREGCLDRSRRDGVSETDIDLYRQPGVLKVSKERGANPFVLLVFLDLFHFDRSRIELETIILDNQSADSFEERLEPLWTVVTSRKKV